MALRDHGLVIELMGNFTGGTLYFKGNNISNAQNYFRYQERESDTPNHCEKTIGNLHIDPDQFQAFQFKTKVLQQTHMISLNKIKTSDFIIVKNNISQTSLTGQLIFIDCVKNQRDQNLIFAENSISYIHSYLGTGVLKFIRYFLYSTKSPDGKMVISQQENFNSNTYLAYVSFSGGITIQGNTFKHIVGCPSVDTTMFNIAVALYDPILTDTSLSFQRSIILPNNQYFFDSSQYIAGNRDTVTENFIFITYQMPQFYTIKQIEYESDAGNKYKTYKMRTYIKGNTYSELSMGVGNPAESSTLPSKGSLHKFNSVAVVHFVDESYVNIGGFTREHLALMIMKVKGQDTTLDAKPLFKMTEIDTSLAYYDIKGAIYTNYLSCTLIYGFSNMHLGIYGNSTFDNIWLIDKYGAFTTSQDESDPDYGLLINVKQFLGNLTIGGPDPGDSSTNQGQFVTIQNLQGYLNDYTINSYTEWDPRNLYKIDEFQVTDITEEQRRQAGLDNTCQINVPYTQTCTNSQYRGAQSKLMKQGQGSMIFNIVKTSNYFRNIDFKNVIIQNVYGRVEVPLPTGSLIMDTRIGSNPFMGVLSFSMANAQIKNCRFENGKAMMEVVGQQVAFNNLIIQGISNDTTLSFLKTYNTYTTLTGQNYYPMVKPFFRFIMAQEKLPNLQNFVNTVSFNNSVFSYISSQSSAVFESYIIKDKGNDETLPQITIENCIFSFNSGSSSGSIFQDTSEYLLSYQITIKNTKFIQNYGASGLFVLTSPLNAILFDLCTFYENKGASAKVMELTGSLVSQVSVTNSQFAMEPYNLQYMRFVILLDGNNEMKLFNQAPQIYLSGFKGKFVAKNVTGSYLAYAHFGAFLAMDDGSTQVEVDNCTFYACAAWFGGAITLQTGSYLTLTNTNFFYNSAYFAGAFFLNSVAVMTAENLTIQFNHAMLGGVFRSSGGSSMNITNAVISSNAALWEDSIGMIIEGKLVTIFTNVTFKQNKMLGLTPAAEDKGIEITACSLLVGFYSCKFLDNQGTKLTPNIYMNKALNVVIGDTLFQNQDPLDYSTSSIKGGFLHMIGGSSVTISNSVFKSGQASQGGAIFMLGDTSLYLSNCEFEDNIAQKRGGAIAAITFETIDINTGTTFTSNKAEESVGDVIYALNTEGKLILNSTNLYNSISQNFMYLQDIANLYIIDTMFEASAIIQSRLNISLYTLDTALVLTNVRNLTMDGCVFKNLISNQPTYGAGALYITESAINKKPSNRLMIGATKFQNCAGINGGALAIVDVGHVYIGNGSEFTSNKASINGGALYFNCLNHGFKIDMCSIMFENGVSFTSNTAGGEGGAVKWNFYEPINITSQSIFKSNQASLYGNDIASVPQKLVKLSSSALRQLSDSSYSSGAISNVSSGGSISLTFELQDKYGQKVTTDSTSKLFISSVVTKGVSGFTSSIESSTQIGCDNGTFTVSDFKFVGQPNSTRSIKIRTDGIDYGIPSNEEYRQERLQAASNSLGGKIYGEQDQQKAYEQELVEMSESVYVELNLRTCLPGEELLSSGKCQECSSGKYLLTSPDINTPTSCKDCPSSEKAVCEGGNAIYPQPGYWRSSIYSDNFIECRNDVACLGRNGDENNLLGACYLGYQGTLCVDCQLGFSRTGSSYKCSRCPEQADNSTRVTFLFVAMIIAIVLLVRSSLAGALEKKNYLSVFIRILMNHFQLLTLTASFDLDWPDSLKNFFQATKPVSEVTTQFLSFDCFIDTRKEDGEEVMRVFYSKMIMMAILPMIIIAISYVVWNIIFLFKRNRPSTISVKPQSNQNPSLDTSLNDTHPSNMLTHSQTLSDASDQKTGRIVSTIIIVLFLVHPTITTIMFNAFNCQNIDGTNRLYEDLEILCGQGQHKLYSLTIALPSIIIWGLGIPTMAVFMLYQRRKELGVIETKAKFGFLYNGYRIPQAYYWELVIMYRKIIVIFIQVFLAQLGKIVQALTMLLFLILCLTLTAAKQPFANHFLNSLEALSLLSSAVTVYCGLFYIAKASFKKESSFEMTTEAELFLFITIILTHIAFLGYWGYHFLSEIRTTIRKKAPKLYFSLFLCCRKGVLESELQIEDARERMGPMLQTIDRIQEYLHERKMMYVQGQIPWEDEAFKRMVGMCKGYVDRVDRMMAFSIGEGQEKGLSVADLMLDKQRSSSVTKLRPKQQKSMKRKMMGAERLIMALDSEIGLQPRLNDNESQIGFDDEGTQRHQINALPRFESRNELEEQNVGQDDDENGAIDFNDYTLNQLSQEIEASNMTLITKGPFEEKKFPFKRYSQGDLETSQNNKSLLLSGTPYAQSPILQLDLLGGQATFADFKILNSARLMKEAPDFYNHHETTLEPEIQATPHHLHRTSTEDAVTILPRSSTKNLSKNKSAQSISSVNSGKIKESRFKRARKEQIMASTAIIALQGFEVISEEDEKVGMPSTQIIQTTREQKGDTLVVKNLLMDEEDSMLEEEMHRALQNV